MPDQKASMAVPLSFTVIMGSAMERDVASIAAASVTRQSDEKARMKAVVGLKTSNFVSRGFSSGVATPAPVSAGPFSLAPSSCDGGVTVDISVGSSVRVTTLALLVEGLFTSPQASCWSSCA